MLRTRGRCWRLSRYRSYPHISRARYGGGGCGVGLLRRQPLLVVGLAGYDLIEVEVKKAVKVSESRLERCDDESSCLLTFSRRGIEAIIYTPQRPNDTSERLATISLLDRPLAKSERLSDLLHKLIHWSNVRSTYSGRSRCAHQWETSIPIRTLGVRNGQLETVYLNGSRVFRSSVNPVGGSLVIRY